MPDVMPDSFACPRCGEPLTWDDVRDDWDHPSPLALLACVKLAYADTFRLFEERYGGGDYA